MADPFIDETDLSEYIGRDVTSDPGALIAIDAACDFCRDISEQVFNEVTDDTITLNGTGTDALLLPQIPVTAVSDVAVLDADGDFAAAAVGDFAFTSDGVLYATDTLGTSTFGSIWPIGRQNIQVTYDHGYADADLPRSVRMVALTIANRLFIQGPHRSESFGDVNVTYSAEATAVMPTEKLLLTKYKRRHRL